MLCRFFVESSSNLLEMQDEVFSWLKVCEVRFTVGRTPLLVRLQPSSEVMDNPSKLACLPYLCRRSLLE